MSVATRLMPRDRWYDALATAIRHDRVARGWTQTRLGEQIGVTPVCIHYWERGRRKPDAWTVERLERLFGARLRP